MAMGLWRFSAEDRSMQQLPFLRCVIMSAILLMVVVSRADASGFAILEQSVSGLGTAFAGAAVQAEDASTVYFNPAGMTRLTGNRVEAGMHYIVPSARFTDHGSTDVLGNPLNIHNSDGGNAGVSAVVPNFYFVHSISDRFKLGLGVTAPYGLQTEYDKNWVGRYHSVKTELATIDINPAVALRVGRGWSLGLGASAQRADATFSYKADFGLAGALRGVPGALPQKDDGFSEVTGDDWAYGFNLGLMFEPSASTRFGLAFRSAVSHELKGDVRWEYEDAVAKAVATAGDYVQGESRADLTLPETLTLSAYHAISDRWAVMADVTWTRWSRLNELRITYPSTRQPDTVVTLDWKDTWRYALGVVYSATDRCTGRIGLAYDQSPVPGADKLPAGIPDADRYWVSLGGSYRFCSHGELNLAYLHVFMDDPMINKSATGENASRGALKGTWDASVDVFSLNVSLRF
jgi:long-chain fatty acid transport protein